MCSRAFCITKDFLRSRLSLNYAAVSTEKEIPGSDFWGFRYLGMKRSPPLHPARGVPAIFSERSSVRVRSGCVPGFGCRGVWGGHFVHICHQKGRRAMCFCCEVTETSLFPNGSLGRSGLSCRPVPWQAAGQTRELGFGWDLSTH